MKRYVAKRLLQAVAVVYVVATIVFFVVRAIPGDPARVMLGADADPEAIERLQEELALNEPIHVQYTTWMRQTLSGDLGESIFTGETVVEAIVSVAPPTVSLAVLGMAIALTIAIPTGIISAVRKDQIDDYVATFLAFLTFSMPAFWLGIVLILIFATQYQLLPAFGYQPLSEGFRGWLTHIILPSLAVGLPFGGYLMRMMRSSMIEVLNEDYMRTARAKGLDDRIVLFKHGFQNALLPVVTMAGLYMGALLGGVVTVEIVFGIRGLGRLLVDSLLRRDFPIIQGAVILIAIVFVLINLFVDLLYTAINPQIKYEGE